VKAQEFDNMHSGQGKGHFMSNIPIYDTAFATQVLNRCTIVTKRTQQEANLHNSKQKTQCNICL